MVRESTSRGICNVYISYKIEKHQAVSSESSSHRPVSSRSSDLSPKDLLPHGSLGAIHLESRGRNGYTRGSGPLLVFLRCCLIRRRRVGVALRLNLDRRIGQSLLQISVIARRRRAPIRLVLLLLRGVRFSPCQFGIGSLDRGFRALSPVDWREGHFLRGQRCRDGLDSAADFSCRPSNALFERPLPLLRDEVQHGQGDCDREIMSVFFCDFR